LLWFIWLPQHRPRLHPGEGYGIDVSHHQGLIDWSLVSGDGIAFAYVKATEGSHSVDPMFSVNWIGAGRAGLKRGAYHYFSLCSPGEDQARNFLEVVPSSSGALPPAVDLELDEKCLARPDPAVLQSELRDFIDRVEAITQTEVVVYASSEFEHRYPLESTFRRQLWILRFLRRPSEPGWLIWQVGGFARVEGISVRVDLNVMRISSLEKLQGTGF
jgi:lysozyme